MDNKDIILYILIFIVPFIILVQIVGALLYVIFGAIVVILGDILIIPICSLIVKILEKYKEYKENKNNKEKKHMFLPKYWCPYCKDFKTFWNTSALANERRECKRCHSIVEYSVNVLQRFLSEEYVEKKNYYLFNMDIDIMDKLWKVIDGRIAEYEFHKKSIVPDNISLNKKEEDNYYNMVALLSSEFPKVGTRDILYYAKDTRKFYLYYDNNYHETLQIIR